MTPLRLESAASRSRVKHSTTEPLRSLVIVWVLRLDLQGVLYNQRVYRVNATCDIIKHVRHYKETACVSYCKGSASRSAGCIL